MFSGIISAIGTIKKSERKNGSLFLTIEKPPGFKLAPGDSIATNGVCLTVRSVHKGAYTTELMPATLDTTSFGQTTPKRVNLERPITLSTRLDGHIVLGHVDTIGKIQKINQQGASTLFSISFPSGCGKWVVKKGSITVDGIGLTVVSVTRNQFTVSLVEFTLSHTTLGEKVLGSAVNLEFDIIAKYIEKQKKR